MLNNKIHPPHRNMKKGRIQRNFIIRHSSLSAYETADDWHDILRFSLKETSSLVVRHSLLVFRYSLLCSFILLFLLLPVQAGQTCRGSIIATAPATRFTINDNGTATDNTTFLMWMRCSLGQEWNGKTCVQKAALYNWADALKEAANHEFAGYTDWRLPNKNELESIIESRCFTPAVDSEIFPGTPSAFFWTSSPYAAVSSAAWSVDFGYGTINASVEKEL
jgi:hypothetical protein